MFLSVRLSSSLPPFPHLGRRRHGVQVRSEVPLHEYGAFYSSSSIPRMQSSTSVLVYRLLRVRLLNFRFFPCPAPASQPCSNLTFHRSKPRASPLWTRIGTLPSIHESPLLSRPERYKVWTSRRLHMVPSHSTSALSCRSPTIISSIPI